MTERYDDAAARHYAAYRPPLHRLILERALEGEAPFGVGLDVGCGTGYSAVALAGFCRQVLGVEPIPAMLAHAIPHARVTYHAGAAEALPLPGAAVDVATFAGVLPYVDAAATRAELRRVVRPGGCVVAYDFDVRLDAVTAHFGLPRQPGASGYDHRANLSGAPGLQERQVASERVTVPMTPEELAHVLLSDSHRLDAFRARLGAADPFPVLVRALAGAPAVEAEIFYSHYRLPPAERP